MTSGVKNSGNPDRDYSYKNQTEKINTKSHHSKSSLRFQKCLVAGKICKPLILGKRNAPASRIHILKNSLNFLSLLIEVIALLENCAYEKRTVFPWSAHARSGMFRNSHRESLITAINTYANSSSRFVPPNTGSTRGRDMWQSRVISGRRETTSQVVCERAAATGKTSAERESERKRVPDDCTSNEESARYRAVIRLLWLNRTPSSTVASLRHFATLLTPLTALRRVENIFRAMCILTSASPVKP